MVIGNPPYVEISEIKNQYSLKGLKLINTGNLYAVCTEKFISLLSEEGRIGVIIPISSVSTPRMSLLMKLISDQLVIHISNFAVRPGKLFVGVDMNLTILVGRKKRPQENTSAFSTAYMRWNKESREHLFNTLAYSPIELVTPAEAYPKLGTKTALQLYEKASKYHTISRYFSNTGSTSVYYHSGGRYFRKCIRKKLSNEYKEIKIIKGMEDLAVCLLSSSFYYWLWITFSDCYHVTQGDISILPIPDSLTKDTQLKELATQFLADLEKHSQVRVRNRADGGKKEEVNYYVGKSKPIIDEIDRVLAKHYGFTDEELDFIINYDIKYRMGREGGEDMEE